MANIEIHLLGRFLLSHLLVSKKHTRTAKRMRYNKDC